VNPSHFPIIFRGHFAPDFPSPFSAVPAPRCGEAEEKLGRFRFFNFSFSDSPFHLISIWAFSTNGTESGDDRGRVAALRLQPSGDWWAASIARLGFATNLSDPVAGE
jgi:hypothetical protein